MEREGGRERIMEWGAAAAYDCVSVDLFYIGDDADGGAPEVELA